MSVGVIAHLDNPTVDEVVEMVVTAERAGADWVGVADAFWWRDVWVLLAAAAEATSTVAIGPTVTNPYLRHPFHTVAALATLQERAPGRVFLGLGAGGSEVSAAAGVPRADAAERVADLIDLVRRVESGEALDPESGRSLELTLEPVPVLVAARGRRMLEMGGERADRVLLLSVPRSDLERSAGLVDDGAADRGERPELVWAPLVEHGPDLGPRLRNMAVYATVNSAPVVRETWGLDDDLVTEIRRAMVQGGTAAAVEMVPEAAFDDLVLRDTDPSVAAEIGRSIGARSIAVPCHDVTTLADHVAWAATVENALDH